MSTEQRRYEWGDKVWLNLEVKAIVIGVEIRNEYPYKVATDNGGFHWVQSDRLILRDDDKPKAWRLPEVGDTVRMTNRSYCSYGREDVISHIDWARDEPITISGIPYSVSDMELVRLRDDPGPPADHVADPGKVIEPKPATTHDPVKKARHYNVHPSGVECITIVEHFDFVIGNIIKYAWRAGLKDPEKRLEDLQKCLYYASRAVSREESRNGVD